MKLAFLRKGKSVPIPIAPTIVLTERQREALESIARRPTSTQQQVLRARIVLQAARGKTNLQIAADLGIDRDTVSKWRRRWSDGSEALAAVENQTEQRKPLSEQIEQRANSRPNRFVRLFRWPVRTPKSRGDR